jgi:hypothetical protein
LAAEECVTLEATIATMNLLCFGGFGTVADDPPKPRRTRVCFLGTMGLPVGLHPLLKRGMKGEDMDSQFHRLQWGCIFLLFLFIASCSLQTMKRPEGGKEFFEETSRLEKRAGEHPKTSVRAQSHLQLAFLYVNYRNPQINYTRALHEMESYFSVAPGKAQTDDVQNWLAVLKEVGKLQTGMERMQKVNKSLRDEVAGLKETIERLKSLDRHIEERRSLTK